MKKFLFVVMLILCMAMVGSVAAQDATIAPEPAATEAAVVPDMPIVVEDGGTVIVNPPAEEPRVIGDTVPASTFNIVVVAVAGIIIALIAAYSIHTGKTGEQLYNSVPATIRGFSNAGLEYFRNEAEKTPDESDDEWLERLANSIGKEFVRLPGGRIILQDMEDDDDDPVGNSESTGATPNG